METRSVQVPISVGYGMPMATMPSMTMAMPMGYGTMPMSYGTVPSAPPTDPSLVFQAPNDDAISA